MNLLAADIGGTKTLVGVYEFSEGKINLLHKSYYCSRDWNGIEPILDNYLSILPNGIKHLEACCLGVAGPVKNGIAKLSNLEWEISELNLKSFYNINHLIILNDFVCLANAIPYLQKDQYKCIQNSNNNYQSTNSFFAILGAGTGLGIARGFINQNKVKVLPSEGGHCEFAPRCEKEWEISQWLKQDLGLNRLSIERIVSGTGLAHIARWRLSQEDAQFHQLNHIANNNVIDSNDIKNLPKTVSQLALKGDPLMSEVLETWLGAYGSVAGDLALKELCDVIWVAGGTAAKHLEGLRSEIFLKALKNKGRFSSYLKNLPIMALVDPEAGLFGAACKAHQLAEFDSKLFDI